MVASTSFKDYGRTEFRAGGSVSLSCGAQSDCSIITWLFNYNNRDAVELVVGRKVKSEDNKERLHVTEECSLVVKKWSKEDEGVYTCRGFPSSGGGVDHTRHEVKLITSTNRPTPTTVKVPLPHGVANTTCTSTSKPTTTQVKGAASSSPAARPSTSTPTTHTLNGAASSSTTSRPPTTPTPHTPNGGSPTEPPSRGLYIGVGVALGTAVLLIVGLVLLIRWLRRRGNKRPKDTTTIGLNSIRDTPPVIGGLHDQHLSVDGDQGGGPTYASIVLPEGQRSVATAQVEDDSSDAVTYSSVRASPRCGEKAGDVDVHYATVNKRAK
ncbi:mucin-5AC isoform X3 [Gadus chalcogrammus]|uniref:mucin-5AC isoform X3 n=1 Tax=Gadus chalcogrammus TaxID=1042646 RepID=UPI0024C4E4E6|nr:mucin-5AC isoform X3 [Gadus chalcogrammus]